MISTPQPKKKYFAHASSFIDEGCTIGAETKIWHFCHVMAGAKIGRRCSIGQNVNIGGRAVIGDDVRIQNNVSVYDGVTLEDGVFCGPSMVFTNVINPRARYPKHGEFVSTLVKEGASIGANVTIICGITIGRSALIGSGSVVTKDVPDYAVAYGIPARVKGWVCECGESLDFSTTDQASCSVCHRSYTKHGEVVQLVAP